MATNKLFKKPLQIKEDVEASLMDKVKIALGLENPAKPIDDAKTAKDGKPRMSAMNPKNPEQGLAEPDGDADDDAEMIEPLSNEKTWEYGFDRGNAYHQYPSSVGYSYAGALVKGADVTESVSDDYYSVFTKNPSRHDGKWTHDVDADNKEDARLHVGFLRNNKEKGDSIITLRVPRKDAHWNKKDVHEYVQGRIDARNGK